MFPFIIKMIKKISSVRIVYILPILCILFGLTALFFWMQIQANPVGVKKECIPTFADGGGPYYKNDSPFRTKIVPDKTEGEKLTVSGRVLEKDCKTPVEGAVLDIWQANEEGSYQEKYYRGKVRSDNNGEYTFETVVPKGYGEGTGYRPPHIHFKVFVNDVEIVTSQMFFPEVRGREGFNDAYIMTLESKELFGKKTHKGFHNIILP